MLVLSKPNVVFSAIYGQACFDIIIPHLVDENYILPIEEITYLLCLVETASCHKLDVLSLDRVSHIMVAPEGDLTLVWENYNATNIKDLEKFLSDNNILSVCTRPAITEITTRATAIAWWKGLKRIKQFALLSMYNLYGRNVNSLTGREIENIWKQEKIKKDGTTNR